MPHTKAIADHAFGLTASQLEFAREYLANGFNANAAAAKLGLSPSYGGVLKNHAGVRAWLAYNDNGTYRAHKRKAALVKKSRRVYELALEGYPITNKNGEAVGIKRDLNAANKSIENEAKLTGVWVEEHRHSGSIDLIASLGVAEQRHATRNGVVDATLEQRQAIAEADRKAIAEYWEQPETTDSSLAKGRGA